MRRPGSAWGMSRRDVLRSAGALGSACSSGAAARARAAFQHRAQRSGRRNRCPIRTCPSASTRAEDRAHRRLMMENHTYDNYFGLLGPRRRLPLDHRVARPTSNPTVTGHAVRCVSMASTCQLRRAEPGVERQPYPVRRRPQRRLRAQRQRAGRDGLLDRQTNCLSTTGWPDVPAGRSILLLRARPDVSEPPLPDGRTADGLVDTDIPPRPGRRRRRTAPSSSG